MLHIVADTGIIILRNHHGAIELTGWGWFLFIILALALGK